jgi:hypothetical protein
MLHLSGWTIVLELSFPGTALSTRKPVPGYFQYTAASTSRILKHFVRGHGFPYRDLHCSHSAIRGSIVLATDSFSRCGRGCRRCSSASRRSGDRVTPPVCLCQSPYEVQHAKVPRAVMAVNLHRYRRSSNRANTNVHSKSDGSDGCDQDGRPICNLWSHGPNAATGTGVGSDHSRRKYEGK